MTVLPVDDQLPTLPEVHLRTLEACRRNDGYREIGKLIARDPALTGRVLALANSSLLGHGAPVSSVDHALLRLGTNRLHMFVLTAALQQLLVDLSQGQWQQLKEFWTDALGVALTSQALARLTRYPDPNTAFLSGMLHNSGELLLLRDALTLPQQRTAMPVHEISASLASHWKLSDDIVQALRLQTSDLAMLARADHLSQITALAVALFRSETRGVAMSNELVALNGDLCTEVLRRIRQETAELQASLGIDSTSPYNGADSARRLTVSAVRELLAGNLANWSGSLEEQERIRRHIHEINNPLTIVRQYLAQLRTRLAEPGTADDLDIIEEELSRASELLAQLGREPHEIDQEHRENQRQAVLNHEVRALYEVLEQGLFAQNNTQCVLELCQESSAVLCPAAAVRQVVLNLLRNASESDQRPVRIQVHSVPVREQGRQWVALTIGDTGPGLPRQVNEHLFEPVRSGKGEGHSGLGLSIVKQLMDDMGGIINCHSSRTGTVFRLLFPSASSRQANMTGKPQ